MKLSATQQNLLDAIKAGVTVHYMPYFGVLNTVAYYFRSDTNKRCTATVNSLLKKGLVGKTKQTQDGHQIKASKTVEISSK